MDSCDGPTQIHYMISIALANSVTTKGKTSQKKGRVPGR